MLVGGGRWGRVHAGVLKGLLGPTSEILWVARHSAILPSAATDAVVTRTFERMEEALALAPDAAIIVTEAHEHFPAARMALAQGVPTLVEKPLVLQIDQARELVQLADRHDAALCVGLNFFFASYLRHFRSLWRQRSVRRVELEWLDRESETRYGDMKQLDPSMHPVHEVFPHLWTILKVLLPAYEPEVLAAGYVEGGLAHFTFAVGGVPATANTFRRASSRTRKVSVFFCDGGYAVLDFTVEPGTIVIDGRSVQSDPDWALGPAPLALEVARFLQLVRHGASDESCPILASAVLGSVIGAEVAASQLDADAAGRLGRLLSERSDQEVSPEIGALLTDHLAPELKMSGVRLAGSRQYAALVTLAMALLKGQRPSHQPDLPDGARVAIGRSVFLRQVVVTH